MTRMRANPVPIACSRSDPTKYGPSLSATLTLVVCLVFSGLYRGLMLLLGAVQSRAVVGATSMGAVAAASVVLVLMHRSVDWYYGRPQRLAACSHRSPRALLRR